jgi:dihydrofolate synthase/folylpolyglutamate synthase
MTFEEALAYMQDLRRFGIKLGNERFEALLARLGDPHRRYGIAHVAGTKGKGSTTVMIAGALRVLGFHVGGYYSPYVYDVRERVQVDGEMIPPEDFARQVTEIAPHVEALEKTPLGQTTEFELKTAVGFRYFAERAVDFAAVEVGLGGRLDATNVVTPLACVITNIGLDHTHILGDTHEKIAVEKAGIIKPGIPIVTATDEPDALAVICRTAHERAAPLVRALPGAPDLRPAPDEIHFFPAGKTFTVRTPERDYPRLRLRLRGDYQRINAACAVGALEAMAKARGFEPDPDAVREGLARAYLPGRLEIVHRRPLVLMDGAHNAMAARALAGEIARFSYHRLLLVVGMIAGHGPEEVLAALAPPASKVYATQPTWTKGLPASAIAEAARPYCPDVQTLTPPLEAARAALADAGPDDLVLITGSFYVVGDVRPEELLKG